MVRQTRIFQPHCDVIAMAYGKLGWFLKPLVNSDADTASRSYHLETPRTALLLAGSLKEYPIHPPVNFAQRHKPGTQRIHLQPVVDRKADLFVADHFQEYQIDGEDYANIEVIRLGET